MSDHAPSGWTLLLAELTAAGIGGHAIESLSHLPGWVGGLFGGLVMGVTLRLLDPLLRAHGERIARRLTPVPVAPAAPRSPRDGAMTARETYARGVGSYEGQ